MNLQAPARALIIHTLPTLVFFLALLLTLGFLVVSLSMLMGLQMGELLLHPNPFAAYEALWPGQPASSVEVYARQASRGSIPCITRETLTQSFTFVQLFDASAQTAVCLDTPRNGVFQALNVTLDKGYIRGLSLYSNGLQEGTLYLYWGAPDAVQISNDRQQLLLDWDRHTYSATAFVDISDAIVETVTLTAK